MRRYLDLLVARQLRALSVGAEPPYSYQEMLALASPAEETQRAIRIMQTERQRYWLARYLLPRIGERFVGLVYDRLGRRGRVCLTEYMLEFELGNLPDEAQPGRDIVVELTRIRARPDFVDVERAEQWRFEFVSMAG
jgi:exoribonuclease R